MDVGNLQEVINNAWVVLTAVVALIVIATKALVKLSSHEDRITRLENDIASKYEELRKDIQSLRIEMIRGFAKQDTEMARKEDIE